MVFFPSLRKHLLQDAPSALMLPHRLRHCSAGNQCRRPARLAGRLPLAGLSPVNSRTDPSMPKHHQIPSFLCIHTNSGLRSDLDPRSCCRSAGRPILDPTASSLRSCGDRSGTSSNSDTIGLRQSARAAQLHLVAQLPTKFSKADVCNAAGQLVVLKHALHIEIFNHDRGVV